MKPQSGAVPGRVLPSNMNERDWARWISENALQGAGSVQTFRPTSWNGFSTDPVGVISFIDFGSLVSMWVDSDLTGVSDEAFMILAGVPLKIRPSANRYVRCLLLDESNLKGGVVMVHTTGGMVFSLETVDTTTTPNTIGFGNVFTDPSALGFKGLPASWLIQYVK